MVRRRSRAEPTGGFRALEPLGILAGRGAREAIAAGVARPLQGGPMAFTLVRRADDPTPIPVSACTDPLHDLVAPVPAWAGLPSGPHVMGIVNVTPDSFSDGGRTFEHARAIEHGRRLLDEGASILDIGGESTRPGATPVAADDEQRRILPVVEALARDGARISVDTRNATTMARALDAGAAIINDVSGLRHDHRAAPLLAERRCPVILMHMRGEPGGMDALAVYGDAPREVLYELAAGVALADAAGIARDRVAVDPGFGFAKTAEQDRQILQRLPLFVNCGCRIIAGMSRKRVVGAMSGVAGHQERDGPSAVAAVLAFSLGATVVRVHNVRATVAAMKVWQAVQG